MRYTRVLLNVEIWIQMIGISNKQMLSLTHVGNAKLPTCNIPMRRGEILCLNLTTKKANLNAPFAERLKIKYVN